jgi:hypothetical protein
MVPGGTDATDELDCTPELLDLNEEEELCAPELPNEDDEFWVSELLKSTVELDGTSSELEEFVVVLRLLDVAPLPCVEEDCPD